jgi:hypothetical protein
MPRTTSLNRFGDEYEQALLRADLVLSSGQSEYSIQFDTPNIAMSMRGRMYAYFKAIRQSTDRPDLAGLCSRMSLRRAGCALVFFREENALDRERLRKALGLAPGFNDTGASTGVVAPQSSHTDALEQLKRIRSNKK